MIVIIKFTIIEITRRHNFKFKPFISNYIKANGFKYAKKHSIPCKFYNSTNQTSFERNCLIELKKKEIKFLCLAGFMKVLSNNFIKSFHHKIINIHPSLLPKYKGLDTHERVLKNKEKYSGCTSHYVTSELDSGKIILQKRIRIGKNETAHSLKLKILKQEHVLYPKSIISVFK